MEFFQEALLEPFARYFRFKSGAKYIQKYTPIQIVDLGCGPKMRFLKFAISEDICIKKYIGIDPLIEENNSNKLLQKLLRKNQVHTITKPVNKKIPLPDTSVDYIVAFAFFEHIDYPFEIISDCLRVLKPGGKIILTVPSKKAQIFLEFLSFKLRLISVREIKEHKQYFDKDSFRMLVSTFGKNTKVFHQYFEFGLNNLVVIQK